MSIDYQKTFKDLFSDLQPRRKEILERRFGFKNQGGETLQAIGDDLGITRERVRQLINDSLGLIQETRSSYLQTPIQYFSDYFRKNGDLRKEERIFEEFVPDKYKGYASFVLTIGPVFDKFNENDSYYDFWSIDDSSVSKAKNLINTAIGKLKKKKEPVQFDELKLMASKDLKDKFFVSYVEISKDIDQSPEGLFGLNSWPDINPKGVRDGAYLVLKRQRKPLHFFEITKRINELPFDRRKVLAESVHNELIRSPLFVLIGRGIYALKEWGYEPGTVRDMIVKVLKEAKRPLRKEDVIKKVLNQREVQENTIILNLQNKNYFIRNKEGLFVLK